MSNMNNAAVMETAVEIPANVEAQKLARKKAEKIALENNKLHDKKSGLALCLGNN